MGLLIVWIVGIRDCLLTDRIICRTGLASEANPLALSLIEQFGSGVLPLYRLAGTLLFTVVLLVGYRLRYRLATPALAVGVACSIGLNIWWDCCVLELLQARA
jgi:hypothetical protein